MMKKRVSWSIILTLLVLPAVFSAVTVENPGSTTPIINNATIHDVYSVNDTGGVKGTIFWSLIGNESFVYADNPGITGDVIIGNETVEEMWEDESSPGTGHLVDEMWENQSLIAVWHFGDGAGTSVTDSDGLERNLTMNADLFNTSGNFGDGLQMGGADSANASSKFVNGTHSFTVEAWVKSDVTSNANHMAVVNQIDDQNDHGDFKVRWRNDDTISAFRRPTQGSSTTDSLQSSSTLTSNVWYHIVYIYDNAAGGSYQLWINATLEDETNTSANYGGDSAITGLQVGYTDLSVEDGFIGLVDEVRIYEDVLTRQEIERRFWNGIDNQTRLGLEEGNNFTVENETYQSGRFLTTSDTLNITLDLTNIPAGVNASQVRIQIDSNSNFTMNLLSGDGVEGTWTYTNSSFPEGTHTVDKYFINESGTTNYDQEVTATLNDFIIDDTAPTININNPNNNTILRSRDTVDLKYTTIDNVSGLDECNFSINNTANTTLANCQNTTFTPDFFALNQNVTVYTKDQLGNENSSFHVFDVDPYFNISANRSDTGAFIDDFTANVTNTTGTSFVRSTSNGTVQILFSEIPRGDVDIEITSTGFNTSTFSENVNNTLAFNRTYELSTSDLIIQAFDETDTSVQLHFNVTVSNATTSLTFENQFNMQVTANSTVPTGEDMKFLISSNNNTGYPQREYTATFTRTQSLNLTAFLLENDDGNDIDFLVQDETGNSIDNARIEITRNINDIDETVTEKFTDSAGTAQVFLDPDVSYTVTITKSGFTSLTSTITPTRNEFTFILVKESNLVFTELLDGLAYSMTTSPAELKTNASQKIIWVTSDTENSIENQTITVFFKNGTVAGRLSGSPSGGTTQTITLDLSSLDSGAPLTVSGLVKRTSDNEFFNITKTFYVYDDRNTTISTTIPALFESMTENVGFSPLARALMVLFTMAAIMGTIHIVGMPGAGLFGVSYLGFFAYFGWIDIRIFTLTALLVAAGHIVQRR